MTESDIGNPPLQGFHRNLDPAIYHADRSIGSGDLKRARRSPAHMLADRSDSPALSFGRAYHAAILEPELFASRWVVAPLVDRRTTAGKAAWAQFQREAAGREIVAQDDRDQILRMVDVLRAHPAARWLFSAEGQRELSAFWTDEASKVPCKARFDWCRSDRIVGDLKTCQDASPAGFRRAVENYDYHWQEAHYRAGMEALGAPCVAWVFVAQEVEPPFAVACYSLDPAAIELAQVERARVLERIATARNTGRWTAYADDIQPLNLSAWKYRTADATA